MSAMNAMRATDATDALRAAALPRDGERVRLRRLHAGDLTRLQAYRADAELGRFQGWRPLSEAAAAAFIEEMSAMSFCPPGQWMQLAIAERAGDTLIGDIGLRRASHGAALEIGFTLAHEHQGRGLAVEAVRLALAAVFEHTPVLCVQGVADARNGASLRLLQRAGFRHVATADAVFKDELCQEHHFECLSPRASAPAPGGR